MPGTNTPKSGADTPNGCFIGSLKKFLVTAAISSALIMFNGCKKEQHTEPKNPETERYGDSIQKPEVNPDEAIKNGEDGNTYIDKTERYSDSIQKPEHYKIVNLDEVIKNGEDGNMYIDEFYRYPISNKNGNYYLEYKNVEYELISCQEINGKNPFYIYEVQREGINSYIINNEKYEGNVINFSITNSGEDSLEIYNSSTGEKTTVIN